MKPGEKTSFPLLHWAKIAGNTIAEQMCVYVCCHKCDKKHPAMIEFRYEPKEWYDANFEFVQMMCLWLIWVTAVARASIQTMPYWFLCTERERERFSINIEWQYAFISFMLYILCTGFSCSSTHSFVSLPACSFIWFGFVCFALLCLTTNSLSSLTRKFIFESRTTICIFCYAFNTNAKRTFHLCGTHILSACTQQRQQQQQQ